MSDQDGIDYQELYEELKIKNDAEFQTMQQDLEKLKVSLDQKDKKIIELQDYICKNLSNTKAPQNEVLTFEDKYKNLIKEMRD